MDQILVEILRKSEREQWVSETSEEIREESAKEIEQEVEKLMNDFPNYMAEVLAVKLNHGEPPSKWKNFKESLMSLGNKFTQRYDIKNFTSQIPVIALEKLEGMEQELKEIKQELGEMGQE